jgi:diguanylate cyclase (GGDEF)-like protein/PAS domain S-box-containing protein
MLGYSREELLKLGAPDVSPDADIDELRQRFERTRAIGGGAVVSESEERYLKRKDGTVFPVEVHRRYFRAGDRDMIVSVSHDISDRRRAEEALRLRDRALQASTNAIIIASALRPDNPVEYVNPAFERITGYAAHEAIGRNCRFLQDEDRDQPALNELRAALRAGRDAQIVLRNYRKDGTLFWSQLTVSPVRDPSGRVTHFVGVSQDITDAVRYREQLEHQANHDALTGLPNRNLLKDRLAQAIAYAQRHRCIFATLFLDLDNFKLVNDTLGHRMGDELLKEIGRRLRARVREDDTVARLGGDEFVLVLNDQPDKESVTQAVHRIIEALARPIVLNGQDLIGTCSIGISLFPGDGADGDTLLKNADAAMYRAKASGRNTFQFFSAEMNAELSQRLSIEASLRRALERDEFRVYYQPRIGLRTGAVEGMEALIRWKSPEFGLISPGRFIPVAEDSGLIVPIGDWVLRAACRQMCEWHERGLSSVPVSVNISPRQFRRKELVTDVARALEESGLAPRWLEIEVTESLVMESAEEFVATLHALKALGIEISVDDFGTGYSSLNYLKRFPVDRLKVDLSFVRDIGSDPEDAAIVKAIVQLGHSLGLQVTAEGVETAEQLAFLKRCRCDQAQGYLFGEPKPAKDIEMLFQRTAGTRRAARR